MMTGVELPLNQDLPPAIAESGRTHGGKLPNWKLLTHNHKRLSLSIRNSS
ncbi:hypothetical protein Bealeia2_02035 (plasmid) [Candidatus Bealeia paramacronuclearis]|nr:hypothetical protein [Candidatus Bealeia paramacronuclearis]